MRNLKTAERVYKLFSNPIIKDIIDIKPEIEKKVSNIISGRSLENAKLLKPVIEFAYIDGCDVSDLNVYSKHVIDDLLKLSDALSGMAFFKNQIYYNVDTAYRYVQTQIYITLLEKKYNIRPSRAKLYDYLQNKHISGIANSQRTAVLMHYFFQNYIDFIPENNNTLTKEENSAIHLLNEGLIERAYKQSNPYILAVSFHHVYKHNETFYEEQNIYNNERFIKEVGKYIGKNTSKSLTYSIVNKIKDLNKVKAYIVSSQPNLSEDLFSYKVNIVDAFYGVTQDIKLLDDIILSLVRLYKNKNGYYTFHSPHYILGIITKFKITKEETLRKLLTLFNIKVNNNHRREILLTGNENSIKITIKNTDYTEQELILTEENIDEITDTLLLDGINI